jgi:hypothetical protein
LSELIPEFTGHAAARRTNRRRNRGGCQSVTYCARAGCDGLPVVHPPSGHPCAPGYCLSRNLHARWGNTPPPDCDELPTRGFGGAIRAAMSRRRRDYDCHAVKVMVRIIASLDMEWRVFAITSSLLQSPICVGFDR